MVKFFHFSLVAFSRANKQLSVSVEETWMKEGSVHSDGSWWCFNLT